MQEEIKNPWCVYGWFLGAWGFGKVEHDYGNSIDIVKFENQICSDCWDSAWVERFPSLIDAVEAYIEKREGTDIRSRRETPKEIRDRARENFPSYYKKLLPVII